MVLAPNKMVLWLELPRLVIAVQPFSLICTTVRERLLRFLTAVWGCLSGKRQTPLCLLTMRHLLNTSTRLTLALLKDAWTLRQSYSTPAQYIPLTLFAIS